MICITEGIPAHDELRVYNHLKNAGSGTRLVGPNCPGILSPGKANVGIIPASFFTEGNVGVVSRSGTLTYQIGNELAQKGFGNSTIVGIGGDPVPGTSFIDVLELFEADAETELIVMAGEIGGSAEEEAARVHRRPHHQAGRRLHRGLHGAARQDDGPRRRDRLRLRGTAAAKKEALEAVRRAGRQVADRGRRDRRRDRGLAGPVGLPEPLPAPASGGLRHPRPRFTGVDDETHARTSLRGGFPNGPRRRCCRDAMSGGVEPDSGLHRGAPAVGSIQCCCRAPG